MSRSPAATVLFSSAKVLVAGAWLGGRAGAGRRHERRPGRRGARAALSRRLEPVEKVVAHLLVLGCVSSLSSGLSSCLRVNGLT